MSSSHTSSLTTRLYMRFGIPVSKSLVMIQDWLEAHPETSKETLKKLFDSGRIIVKADRIQQILELSAEEAKDWAEKIQQDSRLVIKDRRYRLRIYRQCFIGSELAEYLQKYHRLNLQEAIALGQDLWTHNLIVHVCDEHEYVNDFLFYRFVK